MKRFIIPLIAGTLTTLLREREIYIRNRWFNRKFLTSVQSSRKNAFHPICWVSLKEFAAVFAQESPDLANVGLLGGTIVS